MNKRFRRKVKSFMVYLSLTVLLAGYLPLSPPTARAADNGLAQTPYMGWSSYSMQVYSGDGQHWISEETIKQQSDAMHELLQSHGYNYINIDAGWNGGVDEYGRPTPSTTLYPNGFENLVKYVHDNGQKIGLYMIPGLSPQVYEANLPIAGTNEACHSQDIAVQPLRQADYWGLGYKIDFSNPCAQKYIDSIAAKLYEWGVDFLKFDSVTPGSGHNDTSIDSRDDVKAWSQALKPYGIWFELSWALDINYADTWKEYANGWRVDWDVECYCENQALTAWPNIARLFPKAEQWWRHAGPGGWNDFDSLNVGNGSMDGLTKDERQTAMTLWSISSAQLFTGNDLTRLDDYGLQLLTNDEVIAVNQAGHPARPVTTATNQQVWYANNGDGTYTVGLFNLDNSAASVTVNWDELGLGGPASIRDLWSRTELGQFEQGYTAENVPAHGSRLFKVTSLEGYTTVNNDDTGVKYVGNWTRNQGKQLEAATQNIELDIQNTSQPNSSLQPQTASFDKAEGHQSSIEVTTELNGNTLTGISVNGQALTADSDYTVTGNTVTLSSSYLAARPVGVTLFLFSFSGGAPVPFPVTISDSTIRDSAVNPPTISFDKHGKTAEIPLALFLNGNQLSGIADEAGALEAGRDYTLSGSKVLLTNAYLKAKDIGIQTLRFTFSGGAAQKVTLIIRDTQLGGFKLVNNDDPAISYSSGWNRSTSRGLGDYMDDVHFAEREGDSFTYTFEGTGIEYVTEMDPSQGDVDIFVDGQFKRTVSTSNTGRLALQVVYSISGLEAGTHTLKAVKKQNGYFMLLDQLRVLTPDLFTPTAVTFDQSAGNEGTSVTLATYGAEISKITDRTAELSPHTDFVVDGQQLLFTPAYLNHQELGPMELTVTLADGARQNLLLNITDSQIPDSSLTPEAVSYDRYNDAQNEVTVTLSTYGDTQLSRILNGEGTLTSGGDYTLIGNEVSFSRDYLKTLPVGVTILKFIFDQGAPQFLMVTVSDSTPQNSSIYPASASFDKRGNTGSDLPVTLTDNGNQLSEIRSEEAVLEPGQDYVVSGNQVLISKAYLSAQPDGMTNLEFVFSSGDPQRLSIVIRDTALGRYSAVNDDESGIRYTGAWQYSSGRGLGDYKNDVHFTEKNGDYFEFTFKGTGIELLTETDSSEGEMDIYVDEAFKQTVSAYSLSRGVRQPLFRISGLSGGEHTLKVVKKSGYYMLLDQLSYQLPDLLSPDAFAYDQADTEQAPVEVQLTVDGSTLINLLNGDNQLVQDTDYMLDGSQVTLTQSYLNSLPLGKAYLSFQFRGDYQNDIHFTAQNGDAFTYTFKGTGVSLLMPKGPEYGEMDIYIDNELRGTADASHEARQTQQELFSVTGLSNERHTIKVVKKSGQLLAFDSLRYQTAGNGDPGPGQSSSPEPSANPSSSPDAPGQSPDPSPSPSPSPSGSSEPGASPSPSPAPANGGPNSSGGIASPPPSPSSSAPENGKGGSRSISKEELLKADGGKVTVKMDSGTNTLIFPENTSTLLGSNVLELVYEGMTVELGAQTIKQLEGLAQAEYEGIARKDGSTKNAGNPVLAFTAAGLTTADVSGLLEAASADPNLKLVQSSKVYDLQFGTQAGNGKIIPLNGDRFNVPFKVSFHLDKSASSNLLGIYRLAEGARPSYSGGSADPSDDTFSSEIGGSGKYGIILYDKSFTDVPLSHWAVTAIKQMAAKQIINGVNEQQFVPAQAVTRAQFAAMIARAMKLDVSKPAPPVAKFQDVQTSAWYADEISAASSAGFMSGRSSGRFEPEAGITREEMAVIAIRVLHFAESKGLIESTGDAVSTVNENEMELRSNFIDLHSISPWALEAVSEAKALKLIEGQPDGRMAPQKELSRAEGAAVMAKLLALLNLKQQ